MIALNRPVCIVGSGSIAAASAAALAELGWTVRMYDPMPERLERVRRALRGPGAGTIAFVESLDDAARHAHVVIVAVATPARDDGGCDLTALRAELGALARIAFRTWPCIVVRSNVVPGTTESLDALVREWGDLIVAPAPAQGGRDDRYVPERIVVGCATPEQAVPYLRLFEPLDAPVCITTRTNAELITSCSNAFLALKSTFAKEVASLCDAIGGMADDVLRGVGYDRRIGSDFLEPGIGLAHASFETDLRAVASLSARTGAGRGLFATALAIEEEQPLRVLRLLEQQLRTLAGATVGVWGYAARTIDELAARGASAIVYDPDVHVASLPPGSRMAASAVDAADADALLVLTPCREFARLDPLVYARALRRAIVIDGCNVLDPHRVSSAGLLYRGVGRSFPAAADGPLATALPV